MTSQRANPRPTGVTILAIVQLIGGGLSLVVGVLGLFFEGLMVSGVADNAPAAAAAAEVGSLMVAGGLFVLIGGILGLIAGYGLFMLKDWERFLAMIFSIMNLSQSVLHLFQRARIPASIVGIVISVLIIYYLSQTHIKRAFGKV